MIFLFFPLIISGGISLLSPETMFELTKGWMYENAEPSRAVMIYLRIAGLLQVIAAFYVVFAG